jgi:hypothetical protein
MTRLIVLGLILPTICAITTTTTAQPTQSLYPPAMTTGAPAAGLRVRAIAPEYAGTGVHHSLYLPPHWQPGGRYPVIVEYSGNHFPAAGSSGLVQDSSLGFGLSAGQFIWVVLPFVSPDGQSNARTWWGDEQATVAYAKANIPRICAQFGGDPARVFLCGFSRGAIAVNYIGLHDDQVARLWRGFITHDHYDGQRAWPNTTWGSHLEAYQKQARSRLQRLGNRPVLVMQAESTAPIQDYLSQAPHPGLFTFLDIPMKATFPRLPHNAIIHHHNDQWLLYNHPTATQARDWLQKKASSPPP